MENQQRPTALEVANQAIQSAERVAIILGAGLIFRQALKDNAEAQAKAQAKAKAEAEAQLKAQAEAQAKAQAEAEAQLKAEAKAEAKAQAETEAKAKAEAEANKPHWLITGFNVVTFRLFQVGVAFGLGWLTHINFNETPLEKFVVPLVGVITALGIYLYGDKKDK